MKTLVLAGGGHSHLHCLEQLKKDTQANLRVILISPSRYQYYSGMFSGYTEGVYSLDDIRIDLAKLCEKIGCTFIEDAIVAVDPDKHTLEGSVGTIYNYDLVSFDIGSRISIPDSLISQVSSIKPNYLFPEKLHQLRESTHPVIVGGGASGVELAFSVHAWRQQQGLLSNATLISSTSLLSDLSKVITKKIEAIAQKKSLSFYTGAPVETITDKYVVTSADKTYRQSEVLWLTGPKSDNVFRHSGLQTDADGYLLVNRFLQSVQHPQIFGAGDCISINHYPKLPKNGVYAVRQGPILWNNLKNSLNKEALQPFRPQKRFFSILSTGGGQAFLSYGNFTIHGKSSWKIKQFIDRKFMKRYKDLYQDKTPSFIRK